VVRKIYYLQVSYYSIISDGESSILRKNTGSPGPITFDMHLIDTVHIVHILFTFKNMLYGRIIVIVTRKDVLNMSVSEEISVPFISSCSSWFGFDHTKLKQSERRRYENLGFHGESPCTWLECPTH